MNSNVIQELKSSGQAEEEDLIDPSQSDADESINKLYESIRADLIVDLNSPQFPSLSHEAPIPTSKCGKCCNSLLQRIQKVPRTISIENSTITVQPLNNTPNKIRNVKYSPITILPIFLFNQFKMFYNLFFLILIVTQFIPATRIGSLATSIGPFF